MGLQRFLDMDPAAASAERGSSLWPPRRRANPADTLGPRVSTSRRSILASMAAEPADPSPEPASPVSNTDALLRSRRPSSANEQAAAAAGALANGDAGARSNSRSSRRKSTSNKGRPADSPSPNAENGTGGNALRHQTSNLSSRGRAGSAQPEIDEDRRSISSRRSSRAIISSIMRRGSRQGSEGAENGVEARSRSGSASTQSNRRSMSQRMSSFSKKSGAGAAAAAVVNGTNGRAEKTEERETPPPVPALPASTDVPEHPLRSAEPSPPIDAAPARMASVPASPARSTTASISGARSGRRTTFNKKAADGSVKPVRTVQTVAPPLHMCHADDLDARDVEERVQPQRQKSNGAQDNAQQGYLGAAVGAAMGAGAAVAGGAAAIAGKVLGGSGEQANGDSERDADYSSEDEEFHDAELADIAEHSEDEGPAHRPHNRGRNSNHSQHRARGLSESTAATLTNDNESARGAPTALRGTAGAKRRSGSEPVGADETSTPADAKAKKETPAHVREKAARVAKLTFDDVTMDADEMERDIAEARRALNLFLNSRMLEAEEIMKKYSDRKLYYALGDALIAVIKGFMTFEPEDLAKAISYCKDALTIANLLRKPAGAVASFGRFVRGAGASTGTMASMTRVQRHAELVYAESLLLKAVMGILYSGDFFAFVSEALNLRNSYGIYRSMSKYVEWADEQAQKKGGAKRDTTVDEDFRSGVYLGNGLISMILGLLPGKVLKIMEVFGYTGDCEWGLMTLARAGEWSDNKKVLQPAMDVSKEGLRRQVCDMGILLYHLVISTFIPVSGTDIDFADKVLHYNLERYPQGVFFLYFSGRLYSTEALAEKAIKQYRAARDVQREYVQLQHICYWDMSLCHMSLAQWKEAYECFTILLKESNWSKAVYTYGRAVNLAQTGQDDREAAALFRKVPEAMQRIAGKSIPMEKYCARKAKKFIAQKRLLLPAIEFSYIYHCLTNAPRYALADEQLVEISDALADLRAVEDPSQYHSGADEYWDDYCLAHFLRGVTLRYIAYPEKHARVDPVESPIPVDEAAKQCQISLQNVIDEGDKISLDHYLVYFAHYELGRLYACQGKVDEARAEFNIIMSSKHLVSHKGKYSMQNMCILRSNGALETLK